MKTQIVTFVIGLIFLSNSAFSQNQQLSDFCTITIDSLIGVSGLQNNHETSEKLTDLISNTLIAHQSESNYKFQKNKNSHLSFWSSFEFKKKSYGTMTTIKLYLRENISGKLLYDGFTHDFYQKDTDTTLHILSNQNSLLQNIQTQFGDRFFPLMFPRYQNVSSQNNQQNQLTIGVNQAVFDSLIEEDQAEKIQQQLYLTVVNQYQYIEKMKVNVCPVYDVQPLPDYCSGSFDAVLNFNIRKLNEEELEVEFYLTGNNAIARTKAVESVLFNLKALETGIDRVNYEILGAPISRLKFKIDGIEF